MTPNRVKQQILAGGVSVGTFVLEFATTGIGRLAAGAGAEFAVFDMEHTGWTLETVHTLVATTRPTGMVPVVRVPVGEYRYVSGVLDAGAMGVMVPLVESAEQAAAAAFVSPTIFEVASERVPEALA